MGNPPGDQGSSLGPAEETLSSPAGDFLIVGYDGYGGLTSFIGWVVAVVLARGGGWMGVPERVSVRGRSDGHTLIEEGPMISGHGTKRVLTLQKEIDGQTLGEFLSVHNIGVLEAFALPARSRRLFRRRQRSLSSPDS